MNADIFDTLDHAVRVAVNDTRDLARNRAAGVRIPKGKVRAALTHAETLAAARDYLDGSALDTQGRGRFGIHRTTLDRLAIEVHNATNH